MNLEREQVVPAPDGILLRLLIQTTDPVGRGCAERETARTFIVR